MNWNPLKAKKQNDNAREITQSSLLGPNLLSSEFSTESTSPAQRNVVLICKILVAIILGAFFATLIFRLVRAKQYDNAVKNLNKEMADVLLYQGAANRIELLDKKINLHKLVSPARKNFVDKVSTTLATIGTNDSLRDFQYDDGVLTVRVIRDDILDLTTLINNLLKQENIKEIAILSAVLNTAENFYTIQLEITYK